MTIAFGKRMADFGGEVREATEKDGFRPTGQQRFDAMTTEEQDAQFGSDVAAALRAGDISLKDLIEHDGGFIRARAASDVLPPER